MQQTVLPIDQNKRTAIVDILRGWALLGVVLGNYSDFFDMGLPVATKDTSTVSAVCEYINMYFFAAKSWTLLSILFGYGFAILINNVVSKGKNPVIFFGKRMFWLFVLAFINSAFWFGDILKDYAFLGLLLLCFYRLPAKVIFRLCIFLIVLMPFISAYIGSIAKWTDINTMPAIINLYYSHNIFSVFKFNLVDTYISEITFLPYAVTVHVIMFACMLLGFCAQQINFFNRLPEFKKQLKLLLCISLAIAIVLGVTIFFAVKNNASFFTYFRPGYWQIISTMLFIASGICLLFINQKLKKVFDYFSYMGKMTLTNYMAQNILAFFIFSGVGLRLFNTMSHWFYFALAVVIYILQLFVSKWWLSRFYYGPAEWLWRSLSYETIFRFKKPNAQATV